MTRVVFTGYAPVHFVCFRPIYERLRRIRGVSVYFSGGSEPANGDGPPLTAEQLYRGFRLPPRSILSVDEMRRQTFDLVFCAHVSGFFPRDDRARIQIFHGLSFRNMAVRRDVLVYDHLFITGPYMMRAFREQQLLRASDPRLVPIGFPKVDRLVDGTLDKRTVFCEGLNLVSGLEVGFGGVWVGAAPHLLFLPDENGDLVPDGPPEIVLDGFGLDLERHRRGTDAAAQKSPRRDMLIDQVHRLTRGHFLEIDADLRNPASKALRTSVDAAWEPRISPIVLEQARDETTAIDNEGNAIEIDGREGARQKRVGERTEEIHRSPFHPENRELRFQHTVSHGCCATDGW